MLDAPYRTLHWASSACTDTARFRRGRRGWDRSKSYLTVMVNGWLWLEGITSSVEKERARGHPPTSINLSKAPAISSSFSTQRERGISLGTSLPRRLLRLYNRPGHTTVAAHPPNGTKASRTHFNNSTDTTVHTLMHWMHFNSPLPIAKVKSEFILYLLLSESDNYTLRA